MTGERIRVSVCMAAYRGSRYIEEQVESILRELGPDDELVVVDDDSQDDTPTLIEKFQDSRVRLFRNERNLGYVRTFERALGLARGEYLFLSDQDDLWVPGRVDAMVGALQDRAVVATSVSVLGDSSLVSRFRLRARDSNRPLRNVVGILVGYRPYTGCAMAMRRDILSSVLPIPEFVYESHDLWLALVANTHREIAHLNQPSVARRLHGNNQTPLHWRSPRLILQARWMKARCLWVALKRARTWG